MIETVGLISLLLFLSNFIFFSKRDECDKTHNKNFSRNTFLKRIVKQMDSCRRNIEDNIKSSSVIGKHEV